MINEKVTIYWFRRDLRVHDNKGLYHALKGSNKVVPIFIFDTQIINTLAKDDARISFIYSALGSINDAMKKNRCNVGMYLGNPEAVFLKIINDFSVEKVVTNRDYEPYSTERDSIVEKLLSKHDILFETYKDHVIFEKSEITKNNGEPYVVYTPYSNKWLKKFRNKDIKRCHSEDYLNQLYNSNRLPNLELKDIGFNHSAFSYPNYQFNDKIITNYQSTRDYPSLDKTSKVGPHIRFGTLSIRELAIKSSYNKNNTFLKELIWREFFMQILWHYPFTKLKCFKSKYEKIKWRNDEEEFEKWCTGNTGYPIVDAGMRELNSTGFMHNRVRMIVGSFLCKHLLIDWRWGELYFSKKLLDYEQSSNVGNWQWVAGCGVDAAPYFRIFNPSEQVKKFDKDFKYIKKWVPEFQELSYPEPLVDHKFARQRCLDIYKYYLNN